MNARQKAKKYKKLYEREKNKGIYFQPTTIISYPYELVPLKCSALITREDLKFKMFARDDAQEYVMEKLFEGVREFIDIHWRDDYSVAGGEVCEGMILVGKPRREKWE